MKLNGINHKCRSTNIMTGKFNNMFIVVRADYTGF